MGSPQREADGSTVNSDTDSPSLSQMLLKRKLSHTAFHYPVNDGISSKKTKRCIIDNTPVVQKNAMPRTPASAPPNGQGRSGSKSLGMRRRLKSVENYASPCLRQKRPAMNAESRALVDSKKYKSVIRPRSVSAEANSHGSGSIIHELVSNKGDGLNCERNELGGKTATESVSVAAFDSQVPALCGFKTARNNAIKISSEALKSAKLLFSKIEKEDNSLSGQQTSTYSSSKNGTFQKHFSEFPQDNISLYGQESTEYLGVTTACDNVIPASSGVLDTVSDLLREVQFHAKQQFAEEAKASPVAVANNTSPVLQNRRGLRKRLKRRKIMFQSTLNNPSSCGATNEDSATKSTVQEKPADSSFLSDGLDSELLAVDLDVKPITEVKNGIEIVETENAFTVDCNAELGISNLNCERPDGKSTAAGAKLSKCQSAHPLTENASCSNQQSKSISLTEDHNLVGDSQPSLKTTSAGQNQEEIKLCYGKAKDITVNSFCQKTIKSAKSPLGSLHPLDSKAKDCGSKRLVISELEPGSQKPVKPCKLRCDLQGDEGMSSDDELLLKVGAEFDRGRVSNPSSALPAHAGFTTASRKKITISDAALSKAKQLYISLFAGDKQLDGSPMRNEKKISALTVLPSSTDMKENDLSLSSPGASKEQVLSHGALCEAKRLSAAVAKNKQTRDVSLANVSSQAPVSNTRTSEFIGFTTASKKQISISDTALRRAEQLVTSLFDGEKMTTGPSSPNGKYQEARTGFFHHADTAGKLNDSMENPSGACNLSDLHAIKGLTNLFKAGVSHKEGRMDKAFKAPEAVTRAGQACSADNSVHTSKCLVSPPLSHKKMLGVKHFGDSQIAVSDESLVKAVEMFEELFS